MLKQSTKRNKISLILDSGAFSAWNKGVSIDIDEYIKFCLENLEYIDYIVNLDVIPGTPGDKNPSEEEKENSAQCGYENYLYMIEKGVPEEKLIHVFHQGEDFKWLKKMVLSMEYIGISPANDRTTEEKRKWLDLCMPFLIDIKGVPTVKIHGFGVTSLKLMLRYPWYSVDSTSWVLTGRFGAVFVPRIRNGKYIYDENSWKVTVSNKSPSQKEEGKHISTFSAMERELILSYFKDKGYSLGESRFREEIDTYILKDNERWFSKGRNGKREVEEIIESGLCNDYRHRDELNIIYFLDLEKSMPEWPWPFKIKKRGLGLRK